MENKCCKCKHHRRLDFVDWFCGHPESPFFNKETESFDSCDKFEEFILVQRSPKRT